MKTTLLIDGNWLLMSRSFVLNDYFKIDNNKEEKQTGMDQLVDLMARSISIVVNRFQDTITNIILVSDGGSWRKDLPKPTEYVYKGNRFKDSNIDWEYVFDALTKLNDIFNNEGIITCHYANTEGDDWMYYWSRKLNKEGINTIIWSSDNDLKQLVQVNNGAFTAWYNDKNGLFLPKELDDEIDDELEFFLKPYNSNPTLERIKIQSGNINYVTPDDIVMSKIICGDKSDNIKSIIQAKKGSKVYGVSEKDWDKIKTNLNILDLKDFFDRSNEIIQECSELSKFKGLDINKSKIEEILEYNKNLVWLNEDIIPNSIYNDMSNIEYKEYDLTNIRNNYKVLVGEDTTNIEDLFEGIE